MKTTIAGRLFITVIQIFLHQLQWCVIYSVSDTNLKELKSRFAHFVNFSLIFSSLIFVIRVNLLHSKPSLVPFMFIIIPLASFYLK